MGINQRRILGSINPFDDRIPANKTDGGADLPEPGQVTDQGPVTAAELSHSQRFKLAQANASAITSEGQGGIAIGDPDKLVTRSDGGDSGDGGGVGKSVQ